MFTNKSKESALDTNQRIGAVLRDERIARGLSFADISRECKLQEAFVRAIEEGHTDYLPAHIYFRMFARLYADTLAIDPERLLGKLYPELPPPEKPEFAGAAYRAPASSGRLSDRIQTDKAQRDAKVSGNAVFATANTTRSQSGFDMSALTSHTANQAARRKRALSRALMVTAGVLGLFFVAKNTVLNNGFAGEGPDPTAPVILQTSDSASLTENSLPAYQPRAKLELTIKAKPSAKNAGVVVIADGDTLFNRRMRGGEVYTWNSNYRFRLNIADKSQVEIFIGGQRLQTPAGSSKRVEGLEITQLNYQEMLATPMSSVTTR